MANYKRKRINMDLDKVERKLLTEIKEYKPEYADLEMYQIAKMELRYRLFDELHKFKKSDKDRYTTAPFFSGQAQNIFKWFRKSFSIY